MKNSKDKILHIAIIILGIIFVSIPIFHNNVWLDESYSIGIASKSFTQIWQIGSNDVHPILYYYILHLIYLLFGSNIYAFRIASMIPIAILGILGYTHIRKDFGEKVGKLFSFFTFFLPINCVYSGEIRMYTWAMLFVTTMAIYAYRIYKNSTAKNWTIFAIFSLMSCYTHYYGLATAGIINLILFIYFIRKSVKARKQNKSEKIYTKELKCFTISATAQILIYLPWLLCFVKQLTGVSKGFWIERPTLDAIFQIFEFQFTGNLDIMFISKWTSITFGIVLLAYTIYTMIKVKKQKDKLPAYLAIAIYFIVFAALFIISLKTPILYPRYFLNLTGLFMFFMAFFMGKGGRKVLTIIICVITVIIAILININVSKMNYAQNNKEPLEYIKQDLQENDLMLVGNSGSGLSIITKLPNIKSCFYDYQNWNVEPAYKAFDINLWYIKNVEELENYKGRIWIIDSGDFKILEEISEKYPNKVKLIKQENFSVEYHKYNYTEALIEKE